MIFFLNLYLNSLFDFFFVLFAKKHFVFISRQHLTTFSVLLACHHVPCQSQHNKSEKNKCLACQRLFYFLLSRLQGLILTHFRITGMLKREFFSHLPKHPSFIRTPLQIKLWGLSLTLPKWIIKKTVLHPRSAFIFHWTKQISFLLTFSCLRSKSQQLTGETHSATWLPLDSRISSSLRCFFPFLGVLFLVVITSSINCSVCLLSQRWDFAGSCHCE